MDGNLIHKLLERNLENVIPKAEGVCEFSGSTGDSARLTLAEGVEASVEVYLASRRRVIPVLDPSVESFATSIFLRVIRNGSSFGSGELTIKLDSPSDGDEKVTAKFPVN